MTPIALVFLLLSAILVWGGFIASMVFLRSRPEVASYPRGGEDDEPDLDD